MRAKFAGEFTKDDFLKAQALNLKRARWIMTLIMAILLLGNCLDYRTMLADGEWELVLLSVCFIVGFFSYPWWVVPVQVLIHRRRGSFGQSLSGHVDEEGLRYVSAESEIALKWSLFKDYRETDEVILIRQKACGVWFLYRSTFSEADWDRSSSILASVLPKKRA